MHDLEYYCIDALGNMNTIDLEYFRVDSLPPIITKTMIGTDHLGYDATGAPEPLACPPRPGMSDTCYVRDDGVNGVRIDVADDDSMNCAVDQVTCNYELWWTTTLDECNSQLGPQNLYNPGTGECFVEGGQFGEEGKDILFGEDSTHTLKCGVMMH